MNENSNYIIKNSAIISLIILLGKVLGLLKQSVQAWAFGTTGFTDVYLSADSYMSMVGQILSVSLAPIILTYYIKIKNKYDENQAKKFIKTCFAFFCAISIILIIINVIFLDKIAMILGVSYSDGQKEQLVEFLKLLLPIILFGSIFGVCGGFLNGRKIFWPTQLLSICFSCSIIGCILLFKNTAGIKSLIYGFLLAYLLYCINLLVNSRAIFSCKGFYNLRSQEMKEMITKLFPLIVSTSVVDIGLLIDKIVASSLEEGSVSFLYYGQVISSDIVNAVFITSLSTVLLPILTENSVIGNKDKMKKNIVTAISTLCYITGCIMVLYFVEGHNFVEVVYQRGSFSIDSTDNVFSVCIGYVIGFGFMAMREIFTKVHYALFDTRRPMVVTIIGLLVNVGLSIFLSKEYGVVGISIATSFSYMLIAIALYFSLKKHIGERLFDKVFLIEIIKITICALLCGLIGHFFSSILIDLPTLIEMICVSLIIVLSYLLISVILKSKSVAMFKTIVCRKKD